MRDKTVLIFNLDGTEVGFYEEEVSQVELFTEQREQFFLEYEGAHFIRKSFGVSTSRFVVKFNNLYTDTLTRIQQLYDHKDFDFGGGSNSQAESMQMFYEYGFNTATNKWVQMKRDDMMWFYEMGRKAAGQVITINFIEVKPSNVVAVYDLLDDVITI